MKESRTHNSIRKIKVREDEDTDLTRIVQILEDKHKGLVGKKFNQSIELEEFLSKYQVELLFLQETTKEVLDTEFSSNEVKEVLSQAAGKSAPGPL